jgi:hypothetical protein
MAPNRKKGSFEESCQKVLKSCFGGPTPPKTPSLVQKTRFLAFVTRLRKLLGVIQPDFQGW